MLRQLKTRFATLGLAAALTLWGTVMYGVSRCVRRSKRRPSHTGSLKTVILRRGLTSLEDPRHGTYGAVAGDRETPICPGPFHRRMITRRIPQRNYPLPTVHDKRMSK